MPKVLSSGTCLLCSQEFTKSAMSRHLAKCARRDCGNEERLPVVVEGTCALGYWLHLEVKPKATLAELDYFLRKTWLECCGHMSSFQIDGQSYESIVDDDFETDARTMNVAIGKVLKSGATSSYVYDFGSSTELTLRVLEPRLGKASRELIRLVARNGAPSFKCSICRDKACSLCSGCGKPVCAKCSADHRCGPEMLLPIVNSPRVGTCAYGT